MDNEIPQVYYTDKDSGFHSVPICKTGSGKCFLMNALIQQCVTKIELGDVTGFKLPLNKGSEQ